MSRLPSERVWHSYTKSPARRLALGTFRNVLLPSASFPCTAYAAGRDYLFFTSDRDAFRRYVPPRTELQALDRIGVILATTSASADLNFRFFAPGVGIDEDAVSVSVIPALVALVGSVDRKDYCFTQGVDEPVRMEASAYRGHVWVTGRVQTDLVRI